MIKMNTRTRNIVILCLLVLLCVGAFLFLKSRLSSAGYQKITPEEAQIMLAEGGVTLVDVRTAPEYTDRHIDGALLIPHTDILNARPEAQLPDLNAPIILYCRTGSRSQTASKALLEYGYKNVYDLGGINSWPYETVSGGPEV